MAGSRRAAGLFVCAIATLTGFSAIAGGIAGAANLTVTSTADSGAGTLRDAITQANADANPSLIMFDVMGEIDLLSALPTITQPMTILGPGAGQLLIRQNGANARVVVVSADVTITKLAFAGGSSVTGQQGGTFQVPLGSLTLTDVTIAGGHADFGAAIFASKPLYLTRVTISSCTSAVGDGAVYALGSTSSIVDSQFLDNQVVGLVVGGGSATITGTTFGSNSGPVTAVGGIQLMAGASVAVADSTFAGNTGDIWVDAAGVTLALNAVTMSASTTYALDVDHAATVTVKNTILATVLGGTACKLGSGMTVTSQGHNLVDDGTCAFAATGDLVGTAPMLDAALGSNGGPTATLRPIRGSPAINAGDGTGDTGSGAADQRGLPRVQFAGQDIGAVELQPPTITGPQSPIELAFGATLTISVTATDPELGTLTYQWSKNGGAIGGATAATYSKPAVEVGDSGSYTVAVTNAAGAVTSTPAIVTVDASGGGDGGIAGGDAGTSSGGGNGGGCCSAARGDRGGARGAIGSIALGAGVIALTVRRRRRRTL